ncbi:hypothetical protein [Donghicola eburneus]|uniref:hypothetical protein n=1 Tax=Donghicola eburneus TaxID=393278 RepID=UPI0008DF7D03|nr:hypothetical protein [Donghicola eburneus]SFQ72403.1 hypothetical protein SAMN05421764_11278 [Donghicola eburneus]
MNHLSVLGRREVALTAIEGQVEIRRSLSATRPYAFMLDLAIVGLFSPFCHNISRKGAEND